MSGDTIQPSDVLIAPLTFLQVYQSAGEIMAAMLEKDSAARDWLGESAAWKSIARFSVIPTYLHWVTSGYTAIIADQMVGWLFVRGREQVVYVEVLAAHRKWRRKGIGRLLLRFAEDLALELNRDWLGITVTLDNGPALALYQAEGFRRSHWHIMKAESMEPGHAAPNGQMSLKPIYGPTAEWAYRQFASRDIGARGKWDADPARRMLNYDRHRGWGQDWLIEAKGSPIAYLNRHVVSGNPYLYLAGQSEHWGDPALIGKALSVVTPGTPVTMRLASEPHHAAAREALADWGFTELPARQLWMLKKLERANQPSTPLQGF